MSATAQNNKQEINVAGFQENSYPSSNTHLVLQKISPKHRKEYFEVKPNVDSFSIELMRNGISDKPDFRFTYEGKVIGLETTRCYPPDALIHKDNKDQNKYEIGYKGVWSILE